jgi:hypothetical protein
MSRRIIFVDLDRTIFDTARFMPDVWHTVADLYDVDAERELQHVPDWYESVGDLYHYPFPAHFEAVTGVSADDAKSELHRRLRGRDYAFSDTIAMRDWKKRGYEVRILSFGARWFQDFKLSFLPDFHEPRDIILEAKGPFIAKNFPDAVGFMVDDKRNPDLPPAVHEVWLDRAGTSLGKPKEDAIITISSLEQVEELL